MERIATLEAELRGVREDVASIQTMLGDQRTPGTIRQRIHTLENDYAALKLIRIGQARLIGTGWKIVAGVALLAAAAAPYVVLLASR